MTDFVKQRPPSGLQWCEEGVIMRFANIDHPTISELYEAAQITKEIGMLAAALSSRDMEDCRVLLHLISAVLDASSWTLLRGLDGSTGTVCEKLRIRCKEPEKREVT